MTDTKAGTVTRHGSGDWITPITAGQVGDQKVGPAPDQDERGPTPQWLLDQQVQP